MEIAYIYFYLGGGVATLLSIILMYLFLRGINGDNK